MKELAKAPHRANCCRAFDAEEARDLEGQRVSPTYLTNKKREAQQTM